MIRMNDAYKTSLSITTTGATAATGILECAVGRKRSGGVQLSGTFVGTVQFEETIDGGTTWIAKTVYPAGGGSGVTSATATGQWKFACGGSTNFRVRCSAFTSGPIVVDLTLTEGVDPVAEQGASGKTITYTDKTITSATGSSQTMMAANASRKSFLIKAGASSVGVNFRGGTAVIGGASTWVLAPGEYLALSGADCPVGAINIITTASAYVVGFEGT